MKMMVLLTALVTGGLLYGCTHLQTTAEQEPALTAQKPAYPLSSFEGRWVAEEFKDLDPREGTIDVRFHATGANTARLVLTTTSSDAVHIAQLADCLVTFDPATNAGRFAFDDDGFGTQGHGTVQLYRDQMNITLTHTYERKDHLWSIFQGEKVFVRPQ